MSRSKRQEAYLDFIIREYGFETDFRDEPLPEEAGKLKDSFLKDPYRSLFELGFTEKKDWFSPSLGYLYKVSNEFLAALTHIPDLEISRQNAQIDYSADLSHLVRSVPFIPGSDLVTRQWIFLIWERLMNIFRMDITSFDGTVELYFASRSNDIHAPGRIFFHLVENTKPNLPYPFAFMATYSPDSDDGKPKPHLPLRHALDEYKGDNRRMLDLLSSLTKASERSDFISELMESGELFHPLGFNSEEAYRFLNEVPVYEECGILCRIPNWWKRRRSTSLSIQIDPGTSFMGTDSILSCVPTMYVDGVPMTEEEIRRLLEETEGLALLKGRWVEVNHDYLRRMLDNIEEIRQQYGDGISFSDAFKLSLGLDARGDENLDIGISNSQWISQAFSAARERSVEEFEISQDFQGTLRPYQDSGVRWLSQLSDLGFGACLADDMGLGKSAQMLAYLESTRESGDRYLLVVPASLIGNWQREISKFTPDLDYCVFSKKGDSIGSNTLTITTYGMVSRHIDEMKSVGWKSIILDEAQAIKNSGTKQSKAIRTLNADFKVAMTGTPVENRLEDLWSLFDFVNPGLLGTMSEFKEFTDKMLDTGGYSRLRSMTSPFVLRRLKTDKSIIDDLPDKLETVEMISLSKKQRVLYTEVLEEFANAVENSENRAGLIFSVITKFKQICNHPDQYLGQKVFDEKESGKFAMLREICEAICEQREKVLVFTQYKEMTGPLSDFLSEVFGRKGLVFHGGMTKKARDEAVVRFNAENEYIPYMVISIKAGGTGLNLTSANHVIHFDRWWNPAVENQATDRAFRIGQTKDVLVHKFVCEGTLEEKIDAMIQSKKKLAEDVIGEGESWISSMNNEELMKLFRLE